MRRRNCDERQRYFGQQLQYRPRAPFMPPFINPHPQRTPPNMIMPRPYGIRPGQPQDMPFCQESATSWRQPGDSQQGPPRKKKFIPKEELSDVAQDCIRRIAESKKYVSLDQIENLLLQHYKVSSLAEIDVNKLEHIPSICELARKQAKVNAYIQAFIKCHVVATLHDLEEGLSEFIADGRGFDSLQLGPITAHPLVWEFFQFPPGAAEVPKITAGDVLVELREFLTEKDLWTQRAELYDFIKYLAEKKDIQSPYELGVRIANIGLAVQVLKRAQKDAVQATQYATRQLISMTEGHLTKAFDQFVKSVIDKDPGYCSVRHEYLKMPVQKLFKELLHKLSIVYSSISYLHDQHNYGGKIPQVKKTQVFLDQFLNHLREDKLLQRVLQLAICCSSEEIHSQLKDVLGLGANARSPSSDSEMACDREAPSLDEVIQLLKTHLQRYMRQESLNVLHLAQVEHKLLEEFDFPHFFDLGYGTFLDILAHNSEIKQFLENCSSKLFDAAPHHTIDKSSYLPSQQDLLHFVTQCASHCPSQLIEDAICYHYKCPVVKSLEHGSISDLLNRAGQNSPMNSSVVYESALVATSKNHCLAHRRKVGILGHVSKDTALLCLQNCPLLEDLHEWSQWDVVYEPEHGNLKDFIQKYSGSHVLTVTEDDTRSDTVITVLALETRPGMLLRITADTSPNKLAEAALKADIRETCGHLVSLIVASKGTENTGLMLLGNHMKTALIKLQAGEEDAADGATAAAKFVLDCLVCLPRLICLNVAEKVFIQPLGQVVGQTKCLHLLTKLARSVPGMTRLQLLGMTTGVEPWTHSFQNRTKLQSEHSERHQNHDIVIKETELVDDILSDKNQCMTKQDINTDDVDLSSGQTSGDSQRARMDIESNVNQQPDRLSATSTLISNDPNQCKLIIDQIRREEFGVDVMLSDNGEKLLIKQQERLGRSLDRLSKDLYNKDTHFVLELIQNADDNDYPEKMLSPDSLWQPSIKFIIDKESITVLNNECGFTEKHIRALCDIGKTTKGKHKYGYIGQKGIGFKSVFRVTNCPMIHSNGFHVCFDVSSGPTGYVVPTWINSDVDKEHDTERWTTTIILPLKPSVKSQVQLLAAKFHDIHPSLLLFLHRIKQLVVVNKVEGYMLEVVRHDLADKIIEINHSGSNDLWFVIRKVLDAKHISVQAKSGVDIYQTEIALAFPILPKEHVHTQFQPSKLPVFAFLPLRSYGFRFIIQADFDVPSSRENIDIDSLWNQWLISELPSLFVDALQAFKEHPDFTELEAVCRFIQFIPLEDEIFDIFHSIPAQIIKHLQASPCLPCATNTEGLTWRLPSQLVLCTDKQLQDLIPSSVLRDHLGLDYLHPEVAAIINPTLAASLGIQNLTPSHLIDIRRRSLAVHQCDFNEEIVTTAKWLACIYHMLDEFQTNNEVFDELCKLQTIPLISGRMVSLKDNSVFFPPKATSMEQSHQDVLVLLYQDLNTIHQLLVQCQHPVANVQVSHVLERLGVKHLTAYHIIYHHILPVLETDLWKKKSQDHLVGYLAYIKSQLEENTSVIEIERLKEAAVVLTNHGSVKLAETAVHFTTIYLNKIDLVQSFPGYDWVLLDACYVACAQSPKDFQKWRDFFTKLGIVDFLKLEAVQLSMTHVQLGQSLWSKYSVRDVDIFTINDTRCKEAEMLIHNNSQSHGYLSQMRMLVQTLDQLWDSIYDGEPLTTQLCDKGGKPLLEVPTSFSLLLTDSCWIPATMGCLDGDETMTSIVKPVIPHSAYTNNEQTRKLLSNHVPYVDAKLLPNSSFAKFLGIRSRVDVDLMRDLLLSWCRQEDEPNPKPRRFITSLDHMKAVYQYLYENISPKHFKQLAYRHPIIFVADHIPHSASIPTDGSFLSCSDVYWADPSGLFSKYRDTFEDATHEQCFNKREIKPLYANMSDVFLKAMEVELKPSLESYTQLMLHISASALAIQDSVHLLRIVTVLGLGITEAQQSLSAGQVSDQISNIKKLMFDKKCLVEKHTRQLISLSQKPMMADNIPFEKMFKTHEGVYFVDCGDRQHKAGDPHVNKKAIRSFYEAIGIPYLSQCVEVKSITDLYSPCPPLHTYVYHVIGYIQRLLVADYPDIYAKLRIKHTGAKLAAMTFGQVNRLERIYTLKHLPGACIIREEKTDLNVEEGQFIVHQDHVNSFSEINNELAMFFCQGDSHCYRQLKEVLNDLSVELSKPHPHLQRIVDEHDIQKLSQYEEQWNMSQPEIIHQMPLAVAPSPDEPACLKNKIDNKEEKVRQGGQTSHYGATNQTWPPQLPDCSEKCVLMPPVMANPHPSASDKPVGSQEILESGAGENTQPADLGHSSLLSKPVYLFGPPAWSKNNDSGDTYEEISEGVTLTPPDRVICSGRVDKTEIAAWGEAVVKRYLEQLAADPQSEIKQVIWMNEQQECGLPYDLIVKMAQNDVYVEVKTTESNDKAFFEISSQQLLFAQKMKENYHVYRVFNAGRSEVRLARLINLAEKLRTKQVQLFLVA